MTSVSYLRSPISHLNAVVICVILEELFRQRLSLLFRGEGARLVDVAVVEQSGLCLGVELEGVQAQRIAAESRCGVIQCNVSGISRMLGLETVT